MVTNQFFYHIDPGHALERHAGKSKFRNKFYYQYEREESWTRPGVRAFGRANGTLTFQGFQIIAGNAVPLCHVFYADKAGAQKHCTHHPIYGKIRLWCADSTHDHLDLHVLVLKQEPTGIFTKMIV